MTEEAIMEKYDGAKASEELEEFLLSKYVTFEIVDGKICVKSNSTRHDIVKNGLSFFINEEMEKTGIKAKSCIAMHILRGENFGEDFLIPDISVLGAGKGTRGSNGMYLGTPLLVMELMSSEREDAIYRKRILYEEMGVPEYWIVDLDRFCILRSVLDNGSYGNESVVYDEGIITHHLCGLSLAVKDIFAVVKEELEFYFGK